MTGDDVGMNCIAEHGEAALQAGFPEGLAKFVLRAFCNVVYQHVQLSLPGPDVCHQFLDLADVQVVDDDGNALAAARSHQLGSLLNRFRATGVIFGRQGLAPLLTGQRLGAGNQRRARAAPGAVHRRAGFAKRQSDAASHSSSSAGHEHHTIMQVRGLISGSPRHGSTSQRDWANY